MARDWRNRSDTGGLAPTRVADVPTVVADIHNSDPAEVDEAVEPMETVFRPTREQRKAKAMFYAVAKAKKIDVKNGITLQLAQELVPGLRPLPNWWHNDLFVEWFTNSNTYQQRIDYLIDLQLDNLEDIITNREGIYTARDQVTAGRQLAEYKKAFIDEDKADRPDSGADMIKAIAARVLAAKQLKAHPDDDDEAIDVTPKVDLPT